MQLAKFGTSRNPHWTCTKSCLEENVRARFISAFIFAISLIAFFLALHNFLLFHTVLTDKTDPILITL